MRSLRLLIGIRTVLAMIWPSRKHVTDFIFFEMHDLHRIHSENALSVSTLVWKVIVTPGQLLW